ncbi:hypothetical protein [Streptomyces griseiscabiei]|uniref:Uncharacterized protein n=1 Tax=Streptomyces griseiscabiei TaxID=2993540 RepID=A0ABU4KXG5_9ACTN|nr:hypothetical protein [Streptomyces griseiscabiei]MBZ3904374.1 hypothetical protein [Streptomyces griseiscabiei]MDX2908122.1 hypothetical protein [Streptomyces griseiscabiei]
MAAYMYDRLVTEDEYRQRVRRHRPSSLLPLIAAAAARYGSPQRPQSWLESPSLKYTPWALADAARVCLAYGTEHLRSEATERDLLAILAAYSSLKEPTLHGADEDAVRLRDFLMRLGGEQMAWQAPEFVSLARTAALYLHTPFPARRQPGCLVPGWDTEVFGCPLPDYVGTTQLLWGSALLNAGRFDAAIFDSADGEKFERVVSRETVLRVVERHFATDVASIKATEKQTMENLAKVAGGKAAQLRRFTYNPLLGRPAVTGFGAGLLCPSPQLVWRKATPPGIYHTGLEHFGSAFLEETGYLFEEYVGRQLRLIPDADVVGEITYRVKRNDRHSVDWFVIFDDLVLLVEVKSMMPTENARLGLERGVAERDGKLARAYRQVNAASALIEQRHPAFAGIPADRPRQALIVTLEPFPVANANLPHVDLPTSNIPTTVVAAQEVERLVTLTDTTPNCLLLERAADPQRSTWALNECLTGHKGARNPILDQGWASYPWSTGRLSTAGSA